MVDALRLANNECAATCPVSGRVSAYSPLLVPVAAAAHTTQEGFRDRAQSPAARHENHWRVVAFLLVTSGRRAGAVSGELCQPGDEDLGIASEVRVVGADEATVGGLVGRGPHLRTLALITHAVMIPQLPE